MPRAIHLILPLLLGHALSQVCQAQLVQVRPGYVKAPFVRVYSNPDGSSYVRAPFVGVYSPGFRRGFVPQSLPTVADFAQMDYSSLSQAVREWSARLDADLGRFPDGNNWKSQLQMAQIAALVPQQVDGAPADEARQQLQQILETYRASANSPDWRRIANLNSLQVLQLALAEYVLTPEQRQRRQLFFAARDLNRSLERLPTGPGWQQYLMLAPGMPLSEDKAQAAEAPLSVGDLQQPLTRFDSVNQNSEYAVIAALPAFKTTHAHLAAYLKQSPASAADQPEELPEPAGDAQPSP